MTSYGLSFSWSQSVSGLVLTAASSLVMLKKGASNKSTSSVKKCPPWTLIWRRCVRYYNDEQTQPGATYRSMPCIIWMIECVVIPSLLGDWAVTFSFLQKHLPEAVHVSCVCGSPKTHSYDCNRHAFVFGQTSRV